MQNVIWPDPGFDLVECEKGCTHAVHEAAPSIAAAS
jgi:hypothetical protein